VLNLFRSIRLTHRSGEILEYIDNVNLIANLKLYWQHSTDDYKKLAGMLGFSDGGTGYSNKPNTGINVACIPMSLLSGFFSNINQYIPAAAAAGMKIELELAPNQYITTVDKTSPQITNIKMTLLCDTAQAFDIVNKQLLSEMADGDQSGVQYTYDTYFNSFAVTNSNSVNIDVQQSASLVSQIIGITRDNNLVTSLFNGADANYYCQPWSSGQWRLGSLYLPQQLLKVPSNGTWSSTQQNSREWYGIGLIAFNAYVDQYHKAAGKAACIKFNEAEPIADISNQAFDSGKACVSFSCEKSSCSLTLTGEPTNNSRILNGSFSAEFLAGADGAFPLVAPVVPGSQYNLTEIRFDVFMLYTRVANLMGDNCVVDR
jgi:hypothetical protein